MVDLFSTIKISDETYEEYKHFINNELTKQRKKNIDESGRIQLEINRVKKEKEQYIQQHMHMKHRDIEEERVYQSTKATFDAQVNFLRDQINALDLHERSTIKEFEIFVKILQKIPQYFRKATYVQKRKLTDLTVLNIIITAEKDVIVKVLP